MSDLISRQDAIDVLTDTIASPSTMLDTLLLRMHSVPSAQADSDAWDELSKVYNMDDVPDKAKSIIGDVMLGLSERSCDTCRYRNLEWDAEPCDGCTGAESHWKPYAQTEQRWILCSEQLPEYTGSYLVTLTDDGDEWGDICFWENQCGGRWIDFFEDDGEFREIDNVIAWMPLPEPYKGDE